jgi:hypothetical protein
MASILQAVYEQTKQARRLLLKIDIAKGRANAIQYKGALQWMDDILRRLTFED